MIERLDNFNVPEYFADMGPNIGQTILACAGQRAHATTDQNHRQHDQGHTSQDDQGQLGVGYKYQHQTSDKHEDVTQSDRDGRADHSLKKRRIRCDPGLDLTGGIFLKKPCMQMHKMVEHRHAYVGADTLSNP
jgi:hypothetical protein